MGGCDKNDYYLKVHCLVFLNLITNTKLHHCHSTEPLVMRLCTLSYRTEPLLIDYRTEPLVM